MNSNEIRRQSFINWLLNQRHLNGKRFCRRWRTSLHCCKWRLACFVSDSRDCIIYSNRIRLRIIFSYTCPKYRVGLMGVSSRVGPRVWKAYRWGNYIVEQTVYAWVWCQCKWCYPVTRSLCVERKQHLLSPAACIQAGASAPNFSEWGAT